MAMLAMTSAAPISTLVPVTSTRSRRRGRDSPADDGDGDGGEEARARVLHRPRGSASGAPIGWNSWSSWPVSTSVNRYQSDGPRIAMAITTAPSSGIRVESPAAA